MWDGRREGERWEGQWGIVRRLAIAKYKGDCNWCCEVTWNKIALHLVLVHGLTRNGKLYESMVLMPSFR